MGKEIENGKEVPQVGPTFIAPGAGTVRAILVSVKRAQMTPTAKLETK